MARAQRAEVLFQPEEYERLEGIARQHGVTLPELIRETVLERYTRCAAQPLLALQEICSLEIPLGDWESLEEEIAQAHGGLP